MKHPINPLVDPVFKALFATERNKNLLVHFLNAVLELESPVVDVAILDPHNLKRRMDAKLTIVDVRATDTMGRRFQVEVQLAIHPSLSRRMLFTWSELFARQLKEGDNYPDIKPAISIWLLAEALFKEVPQFHGYFTMQNAKGDLYLDKNSGIHVLELPKWGGGVQNELDRWLRFFKEGERLDPDDLPGFMKTKEMGQAMSTLRQFSEEEKAYERYRHAVASRRYSDTLHFERDEAVQKAKEAERLLAEGLAEVQRAEAEAQRAEAEAQRAAAEVQNEARLRQEAEAEAQNEARLRLEAEAELKSLRQLLRDKGFKSK